MMMSLWKPRERATWTYTNHKYMHTYIYLLTLILTFCSSTSEAISIETEEVNKIPDLHSSLFTFENVTTNTTRNSATWTPGLPDGRIEPTEEEHRDANVDFIQTRNSYPETVWTNVENDIVTIPVYIRRNSFGEEYGFSNAVYNLIWSSLNHITSETHAIRFRQWETGDVDYLLFKRASSGCSSWIGFRGGYQEVWLASWCEYKGNIQHETLHALGFGHEMNRPDRDDYVTVLFGNISDGWEGQFEKSSSANTLGAPYDYFSVMHYSAYASSKNGKLTIDAGEYNSVIGQRDGISSGDILQLKLMYQCLSGPRYYSAMNKDGLCTNECKCGAGQFGCVTNDNACRGTLICHDNTCKADGTSISSLKSNYAIGESITVSFINPESAHAWISVQPANTDPHNIVSSSEAWSWVCGTTTCTSQYESSGTFEILGVSTGQWRAFLILDMYSPYESVAYTDVFEVSDAPKTEYLLTAMRIRVPKGSASSTNVAFLKTKDDNQSITFTPSQTKNKLVANFVINFPSSSSLTDPSTISLFRFEANVKAPSKTKNLFKVQLRNYETRKWQVLGTNKGKTPNVWNIWMRELSSFSSISNFVNQYGKMMVRVISRNGKGYIEVDSLTLTLT